MEVKCKGINVDLDVELEDGKKVNIEIQLKDNHNIEERNLRDSISMIDEERRRICKVVIEKINQM